MFRCLGVDLPAVVTLSSLRSSVKEFMSTAMKQRESAMCLCGRAKAGRREAGESPATGETWFCPFQKLPCLEIDKLKALGLPRQMSSLSDCGCRQDSCVRAQIRHLSEVVPRGHGDSYLC